MSFFNIATVIELIFSLGPIDLTFLGNFLIELVIYNNFFVNFNEDNMIIIIVVPWFMMFRLVINFII